MCYLFVLGGFTWVPGVIDGFLEVFLEFLRGFLGDVLTQGVFVEVSRVLKGSQQVTFS